jgi:acyl-coenzyme A thioesterase PaaI-like protein
LRLKSYWDGDEAVANWRAEPHHCGGTQENLNGGIIASLIDCHSLNLAIAQLIALKNVPSAARRISAMSRQT